MAQKVDGRMYNIVRSNRNNSANSRSRWELKNIVDSEVGSLELDDGDENVDDGSSLLITFHLHLIMILKL